MTCGCGNENAVHYSARFVKNETGQNVYVESCEKCGGRQFKLREAPDIEIIDESKMIRIKVDFCTLASNHQIFKDINDLIHQLKTLTILESSCSDFSREEPIKAETPIIKKKWH